MNRLQLAVAASALAATTLGFTAAPALAAAPAHASSPASAAFLAVTRSVSQGADYAKYDGTTLTVCDRERDGHGVYAEYVSRTGVGKVGDGNGSASPCGTKKIAGIEKFRVCESDRLRDSCSDWRLYP
jgi:hypothetical protein